MTNLMGGRGGGGAGGRDESYGVIVPDLSLALLDQYITSFSKPVRYETRVARLIMLFRMPRQPKLTTTTDSPGDEAIHERLDHGAIRRPFASRWITPKLIVGAREYEVKLLFHLVVGDTLILPYIDSSCVPLRPPLRARHCSDFIRLFEPFISAVLLSRAQSSFSLILREEGSGAFRDTEKSSHIKTQLLFTHRHDHQHIHIYTAHISRALFERFRYPNQSPTNTTLNPLIRLYHRRVPYEPHVTFRQRLLATVSLTTIVEPSSEVGVRNGKRALSPASAVEMISTKRPRLTECLRNPIYSVDPNLQSNSQPP
ncbi:hypothetical protein F5Y08DRAFT_321508 [Xylaria arbuscula]|nr:hypothetical protein F5Y08DRAFT_321508 [Xylaria arbuscula]